jgi:hypothetical protein
MSNDHDSTWLRDQMRRLRQRRDASSTRFEQFWDAAQAQQVSSETKLACPSWIIGSASIATILLAALVAFHTASERKHSRQKEQEFATLDGILMTYWQAPSDEMLPAGHEEGTTQAR